jgi:hypothetical protein
METLPRRRCSIGRGVGRCASAGTSVWSTIYRRFSSAMPTTSMMTPAAIASTPPSVSGAANNITAPSTMSSAATILLVFIGTRYPKVSAGA